MRILQLHKRQGIVFDAIQDKFAIDSENSNFCIADGASQGFLSEEWAKMLVDNFIKNPTFDSISLIANFKELADEFTHREFQLSSNPAIKAVENRKKLDGSYATFLGVNLTENTLTYISSGDCCGFIVNSGIIKSFPFSHLEELDKDKGFIGTQKLVRNETETSQFKTGKITVAPSDRIVLCTDAVARYIFTNPADIANILNLNNFESFKDWASEKIDGKLLEDDDLTILSFSPQDTRNVETIFPPDGFSFPKVENSFIKNPLQPHQTDPKKMLEIQNKIQALEAKIQSQNREISSLNSALGSLKKKILVVTIITGLIGLGLLLYGGYRLKNKLFDSEKVKTTETVISEDHSEEITASPEINNTPDELKSEIVEKEEAVPVKEKTSDRPKEEKPTKAEKKNNDKDKLEAVAKKEKIEKSSEKDNTQQVSKKAEADSEKSQDTKETPKN